MFRPTAPVKLIQRFNRDTDGNITGPRPRPQYDVIITPEALAAYGGALDAHIFTPVYLDDSWAGMPGQSPQETTIYLRFNTEAECKAKLAAFLPDDVT